MKILVFILSSFIAFSSFSNELSCEVISKKYPELKEGLNKETICSEADFALASAYFSNIEGLKIFVTGRSMYSVDLVVNFYSGKEHYSLPAQLVWYPGDSYVILK